jgi:hypothetical protein
MSELKATPGPYIREGETVYALEHQGDFEKDGSPRMVNRFYCQVQGVGKNRGAGIEERIATAQLFAASWELFEALEELLRIDNAREESGLIIHRMPAHIRKKTHAALAKARGGE